MYIIYRLIVASHKSHMYVSIAAQEVKAEYHINIVINQIMYFLTIKVVVRTTVSGIPMASLGGYRLNSNTTFH